MTTEIKTNPRFDKLTNRDISTNYREGEYWFMRSNFMGAFAYWVVSQSPYHAPDISAALTAFGEYVDDRVKKGMPEKFTYDELSSFISEEKLEAIPEIEALNHPKISTEAGYMNRHKRTGRMDPDYDFIGLSALARNVFFMLLRESITQRG